MNRTEIGLFYPTTKQQWRIWLTQNHIQKDAVWLVFYKKSSGIPTLDTNDAIDEALCFGWIDGRAETIDEKSYKQYFCKRKPNSTWSKINKQKIEGLITNGLITAAGLAVIEIAKQNGAWAILDEVEELKMPKELEMALEELKDSKAFFLSLSKSNKKNLLQWVALAKTETTRQKRILEIAENAAQKQQPKQFRPKKNDVS